MTEIRMRAGDGDRARVVGQLDRHLAEGRLDVSEYDSRAARAYAAVHVDELGPLLADLPADAPPITQQRSGAPTWWPGHPVLFLVVGIASVAAVVNGAPPVLGLLLLALVLRHRWRGHQGRRTNGNGTGSPVPGPVRQLSG